MTPLGIGLVGLGVLLAGCGLAGHDVRDVIRAVVTGEPLPPPRYGPEPPYVPEQIDRADGPGHPRWGHRPPGADARAVLDPSTGYWVDPGTGRRTPSTVDREQPDGRWRKPPPGPTPGAGDPVGGPR